MSINIYDFIQRMQVRYFKSGDPVVRQRDSSDEGIFFILNGELKVYKDYPQHPIYICKLIEGDFFGELGLVANKSRTATVIVASKTAKVAILQKNIFLKLAHINPVFIFKFLKMTIEKLVNTEKTYVKLSKELNKRITEKSK